MTHILDEIVTYKKSELKETRSKVSAQLIRDQAEKAPTKASLTEKLLDIPNGPLHLIAEIKKASPSKGLISENFNHLKIAEAYEKAGASALSILTESKYFQGAPEYLQEISQKTSLPILRKDFIVNDYQIYETKAWGASAFLLIVETLEPSQLKAYIQLGNEMGLTPLVEIHRFKELETALKAEAPLLGINNRNLRDFKTNLNTTYSLMKEIPQEIPVISESGISTHYDLTQLSREGVTGVLVGEALVKDVSKVEERTRELLFP